MKTMDSELQARLDAGATTLCLCWRLERKDGLVLGITEHDRPLEVDGLVYEPNGAVASAQFVQTGDLRPGYASAEGALSSGLIDERDLENGLWDGALVDVLRVDWERPDLYWTIWVGAFSEITHADSGFQAELVSRKADLERPLGRLYGRICNASLGDARCGITAGDPEAVCDGRFETCRSVYSNTENFRGFPHMPGNDFVLAGPAASGNTGGKR